MKPPIHRHVYRFEEGYRVCVRCGLRFKELPNPSFDELEDIFRNDD